MSRIGRNPITVPSTVSVDVAESVVTVKGPNGTMHRNLPDGITLSREGDVITVERINDETMYGRCTDSRAHSCRTWSPA